MTKQHHEFMKRVANTSTMV